MTLHQKAALILLKRLWVRHDKLEREIIRLERLFTDHELDTLLERDA